MVHTVGYTDCTVNVTPYFEDDCNRQRCHSTLMTGDSDSWSTNFTQNLVIISPSKLCYCDKDIHFGMRWRRKTGNSFYALGSA